MPRFVQTLRKTSWKIRRRVVVLTLAYCAVCTTFLVFATVWWGTDTALSGTIALGVIGLAGSTIGAYVFGAAWDDKNQGLIRSSGSTAHEEGTE